jgi:hypothetical protein
MAIIEVGTDVLDLEADGEAWVDRGSAVVGERGPDGVGDRRRSRLTEPLSGSWGARLTVAWIVVYSIGVLLEPAPANPHATPPLIEAVIGWGFLSAWFVMAVGFAKRRRYGAVSSLYAGVFLVAMTVACPVSGHHSGIGAWWLFEAAGSMALVALSARALKRA